MYSNYIIQNRILKDLNANCKDNNWKDRKKSSLDLSESYKRIGLNKYYRVLDCSTFLDFRVEVDNSLKLVNANFCKVRLCPMCSWRRTLKIFGQVSQVMNYVEMNCKYKYLFLTLTVKNCNPNDLRSTLDLMTQSFHKMTRRKVFKNSVYGYFRSLEITYNKSNNTYHPHFHIILAVNENYFEVSKYYLSQEDWTELWKSCLNISYRPIVDIRIIKKNKTKDFGKVVSEVAKYTVKPEDFLIRNDQKMINEELTDEVVKVLDKSLSGKRLTSFGYVFKEVHKMLNLDDIENGNLVETNNEILRDDLTSIILRYKWNIGLTNYILEEIL